MTEARRILQIGSIAVCWVVALASPLQAEFVAELYGGGSFTNNADVDLSVGGATGTFQGVKFDSTWTVGGRVGYWFKEVGELGAFGVGLDAFTFRANSDQQDVQLNLGGSSLGTFRIAPIDTSTVAIGFDVLRFRLHLAKRDEFQQGQIQPYASVGPALFITETSDGGNIFPANQSSTNTSVGVKAGAGLNVHLTTAWSLFGEYRFTHFTSDATFHSTLPFAPPSQVTTNTDLNTHHVVGGISFHF
jgi:opacity protein-like surface antigen